MLTSLAVGWMNIQLAMEENKFDGHVSRAGHALPEDHALRRDQDGISYVRLGRTEVVSRLSRRSHALSHPGGVLTFALHS